MSETMVEKWAAAKNEREAIEDFLGGLSVNGHQPPLFHSGREAALDAYFGIDRNQLERERRQLLAAVREGVGR